MHFAIILRILGLLLMLFSLTMLTPVIVAWIYQDGDAAEFFIAFLTTLTCGALIWWPFRTADHEVAYTRRLFDYRSVLVRAGVVWLIAIFIVGTTEHFYFRCRV